MSKSQNHIPSQSSEHSAPPPIPSEPYPSDPNPPEDPNQETLKIVHQLMAAIEQQRQHQEERNRRIEEETRDMRKALEDLRRQKREKPDDLSVTSHASTPSRKRQESPHRYPSSEVKDHKYTATPLSSDIMRAALPANFQQIRIEHYDGTTDPQAYLDRFRNAMIMNTTEDSVMCRVFPSTIKDGALEWFSGLPPGSISNFNELTTRFLSFFSVSRGFKQKTTSLFRITQKHDESLRDYLHRFTTEVMRTKNCSSEIALHAAINGLKPGPFAEYLARKEPKTMEELRSKASGFINAEETSLAKYNRGDHRSTRRDRSRGERGKRDDRGIPTYNNFTPLNARRDAIFKDIMNTGLVPPPKNVGRRPAPDADRTKRCDYHRMYEHTTAECAALKNIIEDLIRKGHLRKYVERRTEEIRSRRGSEKRPRKRSPDDREGAKNRRDEEPARIRGTIDTIAGGFASGGPSKNARKRGLREMRTEMAPQQEVPEVPTISFSQADFRGKARNLDDPVVISAVIANYVVKRMLVDQGSSADILFYTTFCKLGLKDEHMSPYEGA